MPVQLEILLLLAVANGAPILARRLLGPRLGWPLDGGRRWVDGRPWLGSHKTLRGVVASVLATAPAALLLGLPAALGAVLALTAMLGDALSSFIKRRAGLPPGGRAPGLDPIPESLLPLLALQRPLGLDAWDVALTVALFTGAEMLLSPLLYRLRIRTRG